MNVINGVSGATHPNTRRRVSPDPHPGPANNGRARGRLEAVIAAAVCIQAGQGIFEICLPLRAERAGLSATMFGWTGAAHSFGFLIGAFLAPLALRKIGGFGVLVAACLLGSPLAALGWISSEQAWIVTRIAAGFAFAILFAALDTAVIDTASIAHRSRAIGIYVMFERLAMMLMPFAFAATLSSAGTLTYGVGCLWLALIPGLVLRRTHPPVERGLGVTPLSTIRAAWKLAPITLLCAFASGSLNTSVIILLPRWVHGQLGEAAVPVVQAATWGGALTIQLAAGFLARPRLRMAVGRWLSPVAAVVLVSMPLATKGGIWATTSAALLLGITAFSQYGLALIALGDIAAHRQQPSPTAALVFAWGTGAVLGPMLCSAAGLYAQPSHLFVAIGLCWLAIPGANALASALGTADLGPPSLASDG
ncbi:MAG TPA: MFS transporter [Sphingomicrobium sp.]|nr:MFS transporter [Sphingomicrobium sp.]